MFYYKENSSSKGYACIDKVQLHLRMQTRIR